MGCYSIAELPPALKREREALWELSVLPKNTTQCPRPGLKPRPLDPELSSLTMRPPNLPFEASDLKIGSHSHLYFDQVMNVEVLQYLSQHLEECTEPAELHWKMYKACVHVCSCSPKLSLTNQIFVIADFLTGIIISSTIKTFHK